MNMRKAISYRRVSTARQKEEGQSLEVQEAAIKRYCTNNDLELVSSFSESVSGRKTENRPELAAALEEVCAAHGVLVVYSLSRLARSTLDACRIFAKIQECGADLAIIDTHLETHTSYGKFVFNIMAALAEFESNMISDRVAAANKHTTEKLGYRTQGKQPAGYKVLNGLRIPAPEEKRIIQRVRDAKEGRSYGETAKYLNSLGVKTISMVRGNTDRTIPNWRKGTVHKLLKHHV